MFDFIFNFTKNFLYIVLFILLIPDFFFTIPPNGSRIMVSLVHGAIYAAAFVLLDVFFSMKRIYLCAKSLGTASV
jgi:hypothetical protein